MKDLLATSSEVDSLKSRAIVLRIVPYQEGKELLVFYTEHWGVVTASSRRSRTKKQSSQRRVLLPLLPLELTLKQPPDQGFVQIVETDPIRGAHLVPASRQMISFFLAELIEKLTRAGDNDPELFECVYRRMVQFSTSQPVDANFHIAFLLELARIKGIMPSKEELIPPSRGGAPYYYCLQENRYLGQKPLQDYVAEFDSPYVYLLSRMTFDNMHKYILCGNQRRRIIEYIRTYFRIHDVDLGRFKTLEVFV